MALDTAHVKFAGLLASQPDSYSGVEGALFAAAYGNNTVMPQAFLSQALGS
jgi:hypothetical protein